MSNRTFTIIKPDSVRKGNFGKIVSRLEAEGFRIIGLKKVFLSQQQAEGFYGVHRERPFFKDLVSYMTSGPVYVAALEGEGAVAKLRTLMGATDPLK
ncbi:MAG: nucleoside-diphosphate kinase, partial [Acidobacteria bacterium]|nr:nucleoside-diphosphate kinase [Acidobacteriota bacterium]